MAKVTPEVRDVFSLRLRKTRLERGLSLADLAAPLGISRQLVAQYEQKGVTMPTVQRLAMMAGVLGVSMDYLVGLSTAPEPDETPRDPWIEATVLSLDRLDAEGRAAVEALLDGLLNP